MIEKIKIYVNKKIKELETFYTKLHNGHPLYVKNNADAYEIPLKYRFYLISGVKLGDQACNSILPYLKKLKSLYPM